MPASDNTEYSGGGSLLFVLLLILGPLLCGMIAQGTIIHIAAVASSPVLQALLPIITGALIGLAFFIAAYPIIFSHNKKDREQWNLLLSPIIAFPSIGLVVSILLGFMTHFPNIIDLILTQAIPPAFVIVFFAAELLRKVCFVAISPQGSPDFALQSFIAALLSTVLGLMAFDVIPVTTNPALQVGLFVLSTVLSAFAFLVNQHASQPSFKQFLGSLCWAMLGGFLITLAFGYGSTFPNIVHLIASHAIPVPVTVVVSVSWGLLVLVSLTYDSLARRFSKKERVGWKGPRVEGEASVSAPTRSAPHQLDRRGERKAIVTTASSYRAQGRDAADTDSSGGRVCTVS